METGEIGIHQVANGDMTTLAHVGPVNAPEFAATVSTARLVGPIVEKTGGTVRRLTGGLTGTRLPSVVPVRSTANAFGRDWIGFRTSSASVLKSVDRVPLFGGFLGLALLTLILAATWYREGR